MSNYDTDRALTAADDSRLYAATDEPVYTDRYGDPIDMSKDWYIVDGVPYSHDEDGLIEALNAHGIAVSGV